MKKNAIRPGETCDDFFELLSGTVIEQDIAAMRKSQKITITQLKSIYELGVKFYTDFQFKEAEIIFSAYIGLNPYDHRGPGCLAAILLEKGQFKRALEVLNILKTFPTNDLDETILNISLCHYKLKEYTEASVTLIIVKADNLNDFYLKRYHYLKLQLHPYLPS
jgi:tetratricopeptide (TPR) repeat protein